MKSAFIFRRDLRLEDNIGLLKALESSDQVIPMFVFDPQQINPDQNPYFSANAFQFMATSLKELNQALEHRGSHLYLFRGTQPDVIKQLITQDQVQAVFLNRDYTPFSRQRDQAIKDVCDRHKVAFHRLADYTLTDIEHTKTNQGDPYTVFTPFLKKAQQQPVPEPHKNNFSNYYTGPLKTKQSNLDQFDIHHNANLVVCGGREEALGLLSKDDFLKEYKDDRNLPAIKGTSQLSAHHKFGTISIRETYHHTLSSEQFISELYWRDFYLYISYHFPEVFQYSFLSWANNINWINDTDQFQAWTEGKTGVPIVDAGMRQLNTTGWMHNRVRMIVASYLTKNLLINWQWGEKYFASQLVDYDPSSNNGGWQWSASTGADPRPLRIFNPYAQAQKYDPGAVYIKQWVPELAQVEPKLLTDGKTQDFSQLTKGYPSPLVDQKESYHRAKQAYKEAKNKSGN